MFSVLIFTLLIVGLIADPIDQHSTDTTNTPLTLHTTSCMNDKYVASGKSNNLLGGSACTSNDVAITSMTLLDAYTTGIGATCHRDEPFTFDAIVSITVSATNRYDVGVYFAYSNTALSGTCSATDLHVGWGSEQAIGIVDTDNDSCGDVSSSNVTVMLLRITTICKNSVGNADYADIEYATSWDQNGGTQCNGINDLYPSSNSKCFKGVAQDKFFICDRCVVTPNGATRTRPCGGNTDVISEDWTISSSCQNITYHTTQNGPCSATRYVTAYDQCGHETVSDTQTITVTGVAPPTLTCPSQEAFCGTPDGDDNCEGGLHTLITDGTTAENSLSVTYAAEDTCGNTVSLTCSYVCEDVSISYHNH